MNVCYKKALLNKNTITISQASRPPYAITWGSDGELYLVDSRGYLYSVSLIKFNPIYIFQKGCILFSTLSLRCLLKITIPICNYHGKGRKVIVNRVYVGIRTGWLLLVQMRYNFGEGNHLKVGRGFGVTCLKSHWKLWCLLRLRRVLCFGQKRYSSIFYLL